MLKKAGVLHILEFSKVENKTFSKIYDFYSYNFIPFMGQAISGDKKSYEYLVKSIRTHENQEDMLKLFKKAGFKDVSSCHIGAKGKWKGTLVLMGIK